MQAWLVLISGRPGHPPGEARPIPAEGLVVGRARDCGWVLEDKEREVSGYHMAVRDLGGQVEVEDRSTNGVAVNGGGPLGRGRCARLGDGDQLRLGQGAFVFRVEYRPGARVGDPIPEPPRQPPATGPFGPADEFAFRPPAQGIPRPATPAPPTGGNDALQSWLERVVGPFGTSSPVPTGSGAAPPAGPFPVSAPPPGGGAQSPSPGPVAGVGGQALAEALARGAGLPPGAAGSVLTPEGMEALGRLLRAFADGLEDALARRAEVRAAFRIEQTRYAVRSRNPLKAGSGDPLQGLLRPDADQVPGPQAVAAGFDDLASHQAALLAGMRAALADLLARIEPARLARAIERSGGLGDLIPGTRASRLWSSYEVTYATIARDLESDFHRLFGEAFAAAYDKEGRRP